LQKAWVSAADGLQLTHRKTYHCDRNHTESETLLFWPNVPLTRDELRTEDNHISNMSCFLHTLSAEGSDIVKTLSWDRVSLRGSGLTAS